MSDTSLVFNAIGRDRGVNSLLTRTASNVRATNLASAASTVALGGAMASAAGYAVALGSSALGAVGAIGLLPGVIAAVSATAVAGKAIGFGLADAWKATGVQATGGGGKAINTAKQLAMAQREVKSASQSLADAQRDAAAAQGAITRARVDEVERLQDLARAVRGAKTDEEQAIRAVEKAEIDLGTVRRTSRDQGEIRDAEIALEQQKQTLEDVRDRVGDLGKEQDDASKKGVDGSDQVLAAQQRYADSLRQVEQAAQRLADAQDAVKEASTAAAGGGGGGIDAAAAALAKLSPNARAVILQLRALVPAWQGAARVGQNNAFAGVAGDLQRMSSTYLPVATTFFGRMGSAVNRVIRDSAGLATTRATVRDVSMVTGNTASAADRLAAAVRPIINGFMQWAAVGSSFLPGLAGNVGDIAGRFERWSVAARESGKMNEWISTGVGILRSFGTIALNVLGTVKAFFKAGDDGGSTLDMLVRGSAAMRKWAESAEGQERMKAILSTLRDILGGLATGFSQADGPASTFLDSLSVGGTVVKFLADHLDTLAVALPYLAAGFIFVKTAQVASNAASVVAIPIQIAQVLVNRRLAAAIAAQTAALGVNKGAQAASAVATGVSTAATTASDVATKRSLVSMAASKVAMLAGAAATGIATAATWAWNVAMLIATSPITLIVLGIGLLVAGILWLALKTDFFQTVWRVAWGGIKAAALAVGRWFRDVLWQDWIVGTFNGIVAKANSVVNWFKSMPNNIRKALSVISSILPAPFKTAFNAVARLWNNTVGRLSFTVPSWVPIVGGNGFSMPNIPYLAKGGVVPATSGGRLAVVGEGGEDEAVMPLSKLEQLLSGRAGGGRSTGGPSGSVQVIVVGGDRDAIAYFRRMNAQYGF